MKKFLAILVVVALAVSVSATAFAGEYIKYGFEKTANAKMWEEHWYTDCTLRHVTAELSADQKNGGEKSLKITAPAGEDAFNQFGIWCDTKYTIQVTDQMVFDCDIYIPEDGNIAEIDFYLCDDSWDYFSFGSYTVEEWDTWISLSEVYDYFYFEDYAANDGVFPFYFIIECTAVEPTEDAYFYFDNFYFGLQADHAEAKQEDENVSIPWEDPNASPTAEPTATPEVPAGDTGNQEEPVDNTMWFIIGGAVAVAVVAAVVVVVVAKKKK